MDANSVHNRLNELMKADLSFEEKATRALEFGQEYLEVENGHLTRIDRNTDHWEVIISTDPPDGLIPPGHVLDLSTTYCRRTLEADSPIALHDAPSQNWADDPALQTHGLHCYHGTTLTVDDEPYGTVCFVSENPRTRPFSESDTMFAELIGRLLEHELTCRKHETELDRRTTLISVLSRVLRHNLRNDMTVVRGRIQQIAAVHDVDDVVIESLFGKLDKLVELGETARRLDSIVSGDFGQDPTDLVALACRVASNVETEFPEATVTVQAADETAFAEVMPSLSTALHELVENGVKHSETADPAVTVLIEQKSDGVIIRISDDGPGLPQEERTILRRGTETTLEHSSGLGLWLVYWIVTGHHGQIETDLSDTGTTVTITLPRLYVDVARRETTSQSDTLPTNDG